MSATQHKLAGTGPFESLSFWLYKIGMPEPGKGGNGAAILTALYDDPFDGIERANKVIAAERSTTGENLIAIALPPAEVNSKRVTEVMAEVARRQVQFMSTTPEFKDAGARPELVTDPNGYMFFYRMDEKTKLLTPLMSDDLPWEKFGAKRPPVNKQLAMPSMRQAVQLLGLVAEIDALDFTIVPLPFDNAGGATLVYAASEFMRQNHGVGVMPSEDSITMTAELDGPPGLDVDSGPTVADVEKTMQNLKQSAQGEGMDYRAMQPGAMYIAVRHGRSFGALAMTPNVAKMPDGGFAYAVDTSTGQLYSTVSDADIKWAKSIY